MRGLSSKFSLVKGRFVLTGGTEKAKDRIWFYCIFDRYRPYTSRYGANVVSLLQRPISFIVANKTILLGTLSKGIEKYVPNVRLKRLDIGYLGDDRKDYHIKIEFESSENVEQEQGVVFV